MMETELKAICPIQTLSQKKANETPLTPPNSSLGEQELEQKFLPSWLQGRNPELYPSDENLPWHFSFIDDGKIGGSSAPSARYHWPAMIQQNVGLVVNLTESPIRPTLPSQIGEGGICAECENMTEIYDDDVFYDIEAEDDIKVLFLPVQDGNIPRWQQLDIFLKHVKETIASGKRVIVHCQAGVGRTGTFLAVYLMDKYKCTARDAIAKLRHDRPQSLQFDRVDWQTDPFKFSDPQNYNRNYVQERFIELYAEKYHSSSIASAVGIELGDHILQLIDREIKTKMDFFEANPSVDWEQSKNTESVCFICENVLSIGPHPVLPCADNWPV